MHARVAHVPAETICLSGCAELELAERPARIDAELERAFRADGYVVAHTSATDRTARRKRDGAVRSYRVAPLGGGTVVSW